MRPAHLVVFCVASVVFATPENSDEQIGTTRSIGGGWLRLHRTRSEHSHTSGAQVLVAQEVQLEQKVCEGNCTNHGKCEDGLCVCHKDYSGSNCSIPDCGTEFHCGAPDRGHCITPHVCECIEPWTGPYCVINSTICAHNCSRHGHCLVHSGECDCFPGWNGKECEHPLPEPERKRVWTRVFPPSPTLPGDFAFGTEEFQVNDVLPHNIGVRPQPRHSHSFISLPALPSGIIPGALLFGGQSGDAYFSDMWLFAYDNDNWVSAAHHSIGPAPRSSHSTVAIGEFVYFFGGFDGLSEPPIPTSELWRYSLEEEEWLLLPSLSARDFTDPENSTTPPAPRAMHTAVEMVLEKGGQHIPVMVVFGGVAKDGTTDGSVWALEVEQLRWNKMVTASCGGRVGQSAVTSADKKTMFVFGGYDASGVHSNNIWTFTAANNQWVLLSPVGAQPLARSHHIAVAHDGKLVIFGGRTDNRLLNDMWMFDVNELSWTEIIPDSGSHKPSERSHASGALIGANRLAVWGGYCYGSHQHSQELWYFDFVERAWMRPITTGETPQSRILQSGIVVENQLHIFGGEVSETSEKLRDLWVFDLSRARLNGAPMWKRITPAWEYSGNSTAKGVVTNNKCTCQPTSRNTETGITHTGCAVNGFNDHFAWCDTVEPCRFGRYWDYCDPSVVKEESNATTTATASLYDNGERRRFFELSMWPLARSGHAVTKMKMVGVAAGLCSLVNSEVMVIFGGNTTNGVTSDINVYCPPSKQWTPLELRHPPRNRTMSAITSHEHNLYVFGGVSADHIRLSDLWRCSIVDGECTEIIYKGWTPQARRGMMFALESPKPCESDCSSRDAEKFLMFNGYFKVQNVSQPNPNTHFHRCLAARPPYTTAYCDRVCSAEPNSPACLQFCRCKNEFVMDIWTMQIDQWRWDTVHVSSGPPLRFCSQSIPFNNKILTFGGFEGNNEFDDLWIFDMETKSWHILPSQEHTMSPSGRHEASIDVMTNGNIAQLVLYGGIGETGVLNEVWTCDVSDVTGM